MIVFVEKHSFKDLVIIYQLQTFHCFTDVAIGQINERLVGSIPFVDELFDSECDNEPNLGLADYQIIELVFIVI